MEPFTNPFRPGAGVKPPYMAGRQKEQNEFEHLIDQVPVIKNLIITGLRGVGKTVLLDSLRPIAVKKNWFWAGTDLSESVSVTEASFCKRIIADLSTIVSSFPVSETETRTIGFNTHVKKEITHYGHEHLMALYNQTPGLEVDKLKAVMIMTWEIVKHKAKGIVLAYDEAQNLKDKATESQYPLSLLLEIIQYLQRREIPYFLVLTGLPTLFPNLVDTRTYAERMFHVMTLEKLSKEDSREAITQPVQKENCPVTFSDAAIEEFIKYSGGYPYFIQYLCKETFDMYIQQVGMGVEEPKVYVIEITRKLDADFYAGRWNKITDRQRDLLNAIAQLPSAEEEFTTQEIATKSKQITPSEAFSPSHINQILKTLSNMGLVYKNRHGKYSFAVPMFSEFIKRQADSF